MKNYDLSHTSYLGFATAMMLTLFILPLRATADHSQSELKKSTHEHSKQTTRPQCAIEQFNHLPNIESDLVIYQAALKKFQTKEALTQYCQNEADQLRRRYLSNDDRGGRSLLSKKPSNLGSHGSILTLLKSLNRAHMKVDAPDQAPASEDLSSSGPPVPSTVSPTETLETEIKTFLEWCVIQ